MGAWILRITAFEPSADWQRTAAISDIPGVAVVGVIGGYYVVLAAITIVGRRGSTYRELNDASE